MNIQSTRGKAAAFVASIAVMIFAQFSWAQAPEVAKAKDPHTVVEGVTDELMKIVHGDAKSLEDEPEKYYQDVRTIMEAVVDFDYIARNVMGPRYWKSATDAQRQRFVEIFTSSLVETYAKGMATLSNFEISVTPPEAEVGERRKVEVIQIFKGAEGTNRVAYTMGRNRSGEWKLLNVVLKGVNLGQTLQKQFKQSVIDQKGDLDAAINGWNFDAAANT